MHFDPLAPFRRFRAAVRYVAWGPPPPPPAAARATRLEAALRAERHYSENQARAAAAARLDTSSARTEAAGLRARVATLEHAAARRASVHLDDGAGGSPFMEIIWHDHRIGLTFDADPAQSGWCWCERDGGVEIGKFDDLTGLRAALERWEREEKETGQ